LSGELGDDELRALGQAARAGRAGERASRTPNDAQRDELRALVDEALRS
jgi:hypothetical protein